MAITNIMLLNSLKSDHTVVYDQQADTFTVYDRKNGDTIAVFESNEKGFYLFTPDMNVRGDGMTLHQDTRSDHLMNHGTNLLATVKENARFYIRLVQQFYLNMCHLSYRFLFAEEIVVLFILTQIVCTDEMIIMRSLLCFVRTICPWNPIFSEVEAISRDSVTEIHLHIF